MAGISLKLEPIVPIIRVKTISGEWAACVLGSMSQYVSVQAKTCYLRLSDQP